MHNRTFILYVFVFLFCFAGKVEAVFFKQLTTSDHLVSNNVFHTFRDSKGYIWFCTDKGLSKYDGTGFKNYTMLDGLSDNTIFNLFEDRLGRIWAYTYNGKPCFIYNDEIHNQGNDSFLKRLPVMTYINAMYHDDDSALYIGYSDGSILILEREKMLRLKLVTKINSFYKKDGYVRAVSMISDARIVKGKIADTLPSILNNSFFYNGKLLVADEQGLKVYNNGALVWKADGPELNFNTVIHIYCDEQDNIFCSTDNGLVVINTRTQKRYRLFHNLKVCCTGQDAYGNYWVTTQGNGIYYMAGILDSVHLLANADRYKIAHLGKNSLLCFIDNTVYSLQERDGKIALQKIPVNYPAGSEPLYIDSAYFGYFNINGRSVYIYDIKRGGLKSFEAYVAKAAYKTAKDLFAIVEINKINIVENNDGHFRSLRSLWCDARIMKSGYDAASDRLFFISKGSLYAYEAATGSLAKVDSLHNMDVENIYCAMNHVFVFTSTNRVYAYSLNNYHKYTINTGNYIVYNVDKVNDVTYVLTTNHGYCKLKLDHIAPGYFPITNIEFPFVRSDIQGLYVVGRNVVCATQGQLLYFDAGLINKKLYRPFVSVKKLKVNGKEYVTRSVTLKNTRKCNIELLLNSVTLNKEPVTYRYRINEGNEGTWQETESNNINILLNKTGRYTIEVMAKSANNILSPPVFITLVTYPPFYSSNTFYGIVAGLLLLLLYAGIRFYNYKKRMKMQQQLDYLQMEHKAINSLMNPHFVFNAINNIQNLINEGSRETANGYLATMSKMVRQNIENLQYSLVPLSKELELTDNYIKLQNLRFNNSIHLSIDNALASTEDIYIPPLLIHTFVENSIVHGYAGNATSLAIHLELSLTIDGYLHINITDNGCGLNNRKKDSPLQKKASLGIEFNRKRLEKLSEFYKVFFHMDVRDAEEGTGTSVSIILYAGFRNLTAAN